MIGRGSLSAALVLALSLPIVAQEEPAVPPLVENVDVRVINVDVVVTDRKGNPVRGLTIDDFQVFENGRPVKLTNFYEVISDPEPAQVRTAELPPTTSGPIPTVDRGGEDIPDNQKRRIIF